MGGTARPPRTVHPRMRGERGQLPASLTCWGGSSPHARGTRAGDPPSPRAGRFIPACAGNARVIEAFSCSVSVHPRMRGERSFDNSAALARIGSSPHTRGTRVKIVIISSFARFIPAYAGNAHPLRACIRSESVHPRIRGERCRVLRWLSVRTGSSPHTRGTLVQNVCGEPGHRFIPAYAGNANRAMPRSATRTVHPRIRGERPHTNSQSSGNSGSSPHTRGTPRVGSAVVRVCRFIPAYAGNAKSPRAGP